ncbi:hypothetical protein [Caballeronia grimmiae]
MHFYTSHTDEPASGYASEGIAGYVFPTQETGTVALYRWRHPESNLHFYTVDPNGEAAPQLGYVLERTECYVSTRQARIPNRSIAGTTLNRAIIFLRSIRLVN